jgi:uncharacterized protein (TIGR03437 family)
MSAIKTFASILTLAVTPLLAAAGANGPCAAIDMDNAANYWFGAFTFPAREPSHPVFGGTAREGSVAIAPGEVVTILLAGTGINAASVAGGDWPSLLAGYGVTIDGAAAPLYTVAPVGQAGLPDVDGMVTFQVPYTVTGSVMGGVRTSAVSLHGPGCDVAMTVGVRTSAPALYRNYWSGQALVQDSVTGVINDCRHLLTTFDGGTTAYIAIYGYGFGALSSPIAPGVRPAAIPLDPDASVAVAVDGKSVAVVYAGSAPGSVGQYVIIARVPATASGNTGPWRFGQVTVNGILAGDFQYATGSPGSVTSAFAARCAL